jgi:penicillin-insensitive murein endopeptidase
LGSVDESHRLIAIMNQDNDPLRPRPTQDSRTFFMLPQAPMDSGYYVYGNLYHQPAKGAYQYAHPTMMTAILRVGLEWQSTEQRRFGVGDISLPNGVPTPDHHTHRSGLEVDVRPLRKDGHEDAVYWWDSQYDRVGTEKLLNLFRAFAKVELVLFNDHYVPGVHPADDHDNHFHLKLRS